ncbi:helix-turn-helix transcriptional regulator [Robiginitalea sp. SC105]|uniref:helix-turn-helix domain-containing protein n=1 Tax=Robiginitalea sp. SC105 TaxID=2762332 RepID=UPI00163AD8A5|nr:helix-turn-helix transcriptional regulator [Robiginitalea sp. SC105]MBC2840629.1 helix-turn-helix transcriptional regulator [Robiginitalea sp. SC105]
MVNTESFIKRLEQILSYYEQTASGFADEIGVPRSSISHLLSGRNKPSLDFVMKVIQRFPEVNLYWLLNGKGSFPASPVEVPGPSEPDRSTPASREATERRIDKIVIFYSDGTFGIFHPEG